MTDASCATLEENDELSPLLGAVKTANSNVVRVSESDHYGMKSSEPPSSALTLRAGVDLWSREEPDGCSISSGSSDVGVCTDIKDM